MTVSNNLNYSFATVENDLWEAKNKAQDDSTGKRK